MINDIMCSECFKDEGLSLSAEIIGIKQKGICKNCNNLNGKKLDVGLLNNLCWKFFVSGSYTKTQYGGAPVVQFNELQKTEIAVLENLEYDIKLIEKILNVGFFYYAPRLFMLGEVEPLKKLHNDNENLEILNKIISLYPTKVLEEKEKFYRLRVDPEKPFEKNQYDSPPKSGNGRLDLENLNILYGSNNIEICIHECKVSLKNELYIATLSPTQNLKLLDLTTLIDEKEDEFNSLNLALHFIFNAESHSYEICQKISKHIFNKGFDGLIYPSYYSSIKSSRISNIALFGRPVNDGKVKVININRLQLEKIDYKFHFGPTLIEQ
jgi:hypothetical protein